MAKDLVEKINQIQIMSELIKEMECSIRAHNLQERAIGDLDRVANSAWLNLYEHLHDNGIIPDDHFKQLAKWEISCAK